ALDKVMDASTHLLGVINDILDMSKIEANKFELSPAEFSFEMMLHRVANFINYRIEEKKQKLTVHIDPSIPNFLVGDDQRIAQVITNLLANAVKFTPEGGAVSLETKFLGQENRPGTEGSLCTLKISIIDTGIGISAEQQKRLFESFQQAENSTARKYGGTGLGLSISKSIVEMMGGRIWVNSEAGKGSVFSFTLQVKRGQEKQKRLNEAVNLGDIRIMALDNDPDILIQFREIMQGFGISCDTAINPAEAHHLIKKNGPYNIYFIDSKVQGINCLELAEIFKAKIKRPGEAIVIMISPAEWKEIEDDAKKAGIDKFLSKPLFPSIIMDLINEVLGVKRQVEKKNEMDISGLFTGHRIMLVEDVEVNREIVQELLSPTNLQIDCAANGLEAVRMFAEAPEKYGMIFMDVHMPELDGYEATRRIRKIEARLHPELKRIPIVAMTANVFREDTEKCLNAGMDDHVGKPLDFNLVLDKLHQYLPARESSNVPEKVDHLIPDFV
ncbi:MAG: response regulator, partial [Treponema sp.]|nr:response regulator [Treponema sp.]